MTTENVRSQAMIIFLEGIHSYNYRQVIEEQRKQYEVNGWELYADENFSNFKVTPSGKYQAILIRHSKVFADSGAGGLIREM